jgi:hypothetical protein
MKSGGPQTTSQKKIGDWRLTVQWSNNMAGEKEGKKR